MYFQINIKIVEANLQSQDLIININSKIKELYSFLIQNI